MEVKPDSDVLEEITDEYNRDPEGNWKVAAFQDEKDRYDLYVVKGKKLWQVKTEFITPYKYIGVGGNTSTEEQEQGHSFGLRPLSPAHVKKIVRYARRGKIPAKLFQEIMRIPPVSSTDAPSESQILQGPVLLSPLEGISPSQRELDRKLSFELDRLVFKEQVGSIYR